MAQQALNRTLNRIAKQHSGLMSTQQLMAKVSGGRFDAYSRSMVMTYVKDRCSLVAYTVDGYPLYSK